MPECVQHWRVVNGFSHECPSGPKYVAAEGHFDGKQLPAFLTGL